jgi:hypothetical protein
MPLAQRVSVTALSAFLVLMSTMGWGASDDPMVRHALDIYPRRKRRQNVSNASWQACSNPCPQRRPTHGNS